MMGTHVGPLERGFITRMLSDSLHLGMSNITLYLGRRSAIYQISQLGHGGKVGRSAYVQVPLKA
jgi:hypothetical protein